MKAPGRPKPDRAPSGGSERSERAGPMKAPRGPKPDRAPSGGSERGERGGEHYCAGSRISRRIASIFASRSGDSVVPHASRHSSSCATEVTPSSVLATRQLP